ncbi:MAG: hypothetical protein RR419_08990 [Akkermansia sp.]
MSKDKDTTDTSTPQVVEQAPAKNQTLLSVTCLQNVQHGIVWHPRNAIVKMTQDEAIALSAAGVVHINGLA